MLGYLVDLGAPEGKIQVSGPPWVDGEYDTDPSVQSCSAVASMAASSPQVHIDRGLDRGVAQLPILPRRGDLQGTPSDFHAHSFCPVSTVFFIESCGTKTSLLPYNTNKSSLNLWFCFVF